MSKLIVIICRNHTFCVCVCVNSGCILGLVLDFFFFEIYNKNFFYLLFLRICCLYYFCVMVNIFFKVIVGYRNLNKVIVPCVITMAEEAITVPRSPCTRTIRPEGGHTGKEELHREG